MSTTPIQSISNCKPEAAASTVAVRGSARTRVLHINSGNLYGGVETILATLARLRDLCPAMDSEFALCHQGQLSRELIAAGASVHILGNVRISRPWTAWRARRRLRTVLRIGRFNLVICHMPWSLAVFGNTVLSEGQKLGFWAHAFHSGAGWLERLARRSRPDLVIGNSRYTETGLGNLFPNVPRGVVYPPVALTDLTGADQWRAAVRRQHGVDNDTVVLIQVSRLEACKGHLAHLEALAQLRNLRTQWVCWMVGGAQRAEEQQYLRRLQRRATELGIADRVQFLGQRTDVTRLLVAADIFCQPNEAPDSFGLAFVEALWAGRPVVTTALGGALEIVNESCGFLVEPGYPERLAATLQRLILSPELRGSLGDAGPGRALEICAPARQMQSLNDLCGSLRFEAKQQ